MWLPTLIRRGGKVLDVWNSTWTGFALWVVSFGFWVYWHPYSNLPTPGKAIGALAVVAGIMSVRTLGTPAKCAWVLLLIFLLKTEFRAIDKDHYLNDQAQEKFFDSQRTGFQDIATQANVGFAATTGSLTSAIAGIHSTLTTANKTLRQTQPHAAIKFDRVEFAPPDPTEIRANTEYAFNWHYENVGSAIATNGKTFARIYIANADDKDAQTGLAKEFNSDWNKSKEVSGQSNFMAPNTPLWGTTRRTFTDEEFRNYNPRKTIYLLMRFEYTDETGTWGTDSCVGFQRDSATQTDTKIWHVCYTFERFRYPVGQQKKPLQ
ncbi:hypothetical protein [Tunturiibacter gelidoferens]|uniref:Uncharacterized protein n=1 Tax=Tunturiibacter gelidiferens TaxID=3069689 RepID=A0A9X0QFF9_9BACT|nr:hypothetical protein [Edaphobacter lichenicola]MBB5329417.1 hypothetical protein [Edaphobacter lichenicola]